MVSQDGATKAELVKTLHSKALQHLEHKSEQAKKYADKGRKAVIFEPGDWVWLHMRTERFPNQRKSKLAPRGDGPFKVLKRINDNAYQIELPGEFNVSGTFNVADLSPFDADEAILRSESSQGGGNDEDIQPTTEIIQQVPTMRQPPRTRSGSINLRKTFNQSIEALLNSMETEDPLDQTVCMKEDPGDQAIEPGEVHTLFIKPNRQHLEEIPLLSSQKELSIFGIHPLSETVHSMA